MDRHHIRTLALLLTCVIAIAATIAGIAGAWAASDFARVYVALIAAALLIAGVKPPGDGGAATLLKAAVVMGSGEAAAALFDIAGIV